MGPAQSKGQAAPPAGAAPGGTVSVGSAAAAAVEERKEQSCNESFVVPKTVQSVEVYVTLTHGSNILMVKKAKAQDDGFPFAARLEFGNPTADLKICDVVAKFINTFNPAAGETNVYGALKDLVESTAPAKLPTDPNVRGLRRWQVEGLADPKVAVFVVVLETGAMPLASIMANLAGAVKTFAQSDAQRVFATPGDEAQWQDVLELTKDTTSHAMTDFIVNQVGEIVVVELEARLGPRRGTNIDPQNRVLRHIASQPAGAAVWLQPKRRNWRNALLAGVATAGAAATLYGNRDRLRGLLGGKQKAALEQTSSAVIEAMADIDAVQSDLKETVATIEASANPLRSQERSQFRDIETRLDHVNTTLSDSLRQLEKTTSSLEEEELELKDIIDNQEVAAAEYGAPSRMEREQGGESEDENGSGSGDEGASLSALSTPEVSSGDESDNSSRLSLNESVESQP